jgi:tetratricopeptide (TPR) repeat protein
VPASIAFRRWLVQTLAELGQFDEAAAPAAAAIQIAEGTHQPLATVWAHGAAGYFQMVRGDWATARLRYERAIEVASEGQLGLDLPTVLSPSAWTLAYLGESTEALNRAQEAERCIERFGSYNALAPAFYLRVCRCYLRLGRMDEVERVLPRLLETAPQFVAQHAHALHLRGEIAAHPDRWQPETAEDCYCRALVLAEGRGMRPLAAHCHLSLGKLYRRTGQREPAQDHISTATAMYREMGMRFYLEQAEAEMGA